MGLTLQEALARSGTHGETLGSATTDMPHEVTVTHFEDGTYHIDQFGLVPTTKTGTLEDACAYLGEIGAGAANAIWDPSYSVEYDSDDDEQEQPDDDPTWTCYMASDLYGREEHGPYHSLKEAEEGYQRLIVSATVGFRKDRIQRIVEGPSGEMQRVGARFVAAHPEYTEEYKNKLYYGEQ